MKFSLPVVGGLLVAAVIASGATGQDKIDPGLAAAIDARQSQMRLYAFNLGLLGAMAKGEVDYDADAATAAAGNLAALSSINQSRYWPQGSDMETLGAEQTEALAKIWAADSKIGEEIEAMAAASVAMNEVAGTGLDGLRAGMGPLAKSCSSCHEVYRIAKD